MRAIRCKEYGEPESLVLEDVPAPSPGPGEVLVDVHAASVNYPDALMVANRYQIPTPTPFTPGSDFAGTVRAVGSGVARPAVGDRVYGTVFGGAFAEQVVASARAVEVFPESVDFASAAAFPTVYGTAYDAVRTTAAVERGQTLVVLGAAGGVGSAAVQVGKVLGARVIACASSREKLAVAAALGADELVDYGSGGLKQRLKELVPAGADAVLDPVGGPLAEEALRATGYGGRFVVVGFASGEIPRIPLNLVLLKGVIVKGHEFRSFVQNEAEAMARNRVEMREHLAAGRLRPYIGKRFPLEDAPAALAAVLRRQALGKVVVEIRGTP